MAAFAPKQSVGSIRHHVIGSMMRAVGRVEIAINGGKGTEHCDWIQGFGKRIAVDENSRYRTHVVAEKPSKVWTLGYFCTLVAPGGGS